MSHNLGYVAIDLSNASRQMLFNSICQNIPEKNYFQSLDLDYTYINGNVSQKGHITLCYGIKNSDLKKKFKAAKLKLTWQHSALIEDIQINLGYGGKYYIVVAIPEIHEDIFSYDQWIRNNNNIISGSSFFNPHLALCYIKNLNNNYLSKILKTLREKLVGKTIEFESVNFYPPKDQEKINLIKL